MQIGVKEITEWIHSYQGMGVGVAFFLPMLEAFFPILPLFAIVAGNAAAFGLWQGFIFTWFGACTGSVVTFWLIRKLSGTRIHAYLTKNKTIGAASHWFEKHGFSVLFLLRCLPFSPSSFINVLAGLSTLPFHTYFWATVMGKAVLIFMLSFIGADLPNLLKEPWKFIPIIGLMLVLWFIGKRVENRYLTK